MAIKLPEEPIGQTLHLTDGRLIWRNMSLVEDARIVVGGCSVRHTHRLGRHGVDTVVARLIAVFWLHRFPSFIAWLQFDVRRSFWFQHFYKPGKKIAEKSDWDEKRWVRRAP